MTETFGYLISKWNRTSVYVNCFGMMIFHRQDKLQNISFVLLDTITFWDLNFHFSTWQHKNLFDICKTWTNQYNSSIFIFRRGHWWFKSVCKIDRSRKILVLLKILKLFIIAKNYELYGWKLYFVVFTINEWQVDKTGERKDGKCAKLH